MDAILSGGSLLHWFGLLWVKHGKCTMEENNQDSGAVRTWMTCCTEPITVRIQQKRPT